MSDGPTPRRGKTLMVMIVILGLLIVIAFLAGQLNTSRFYLVRQDRTLEVHRGAPIPFMTRPFEPKTSSERIAYAPIRIPARWEGSSRQSFSDRAALDRGIYAIMEARLRDEFYSGRLPNMERVDTDVQRIRNLTGLTDDDRRSMAEIEGDYAYLKAREIVEGLPQRLREARHLCDVAERQGSGRLGDPREFSKRLAQWMQLLVHTPVVQPLPPTTVDQGATIYAPPGPPAVEPPVPPTPAAPTPEPVTPPPAPAAPEPVPAAGSAAAE